MYEVRGDDLRQGTDSGEPFVKGKVNMASYSIVVELCPETGLFVGQVPGLAGAHSTGRTIVELRKNMGEVLAMLREDGEPAFDSEFVGVEVVEVP